MIVSGESGRPDAAEALSAAKRRLLEWHRPVLALRARQRALPAELRSARDRAGQPDDAPDRRRRGRRRRADGRARRPDARRARSRTPDMRPTSKDPGSGSSGCFRWRHRGHRPRPRPDAPWRRIAVDARAGSVTRPAGVRLDPGGIAKGVFADELASMLAAHDAFVVDCAGDMRLGGSAGTPRVRARRESVRRLDPAHVRARGRRRRDQRYRQAELDPARRAPGPPPARSGHRRAGVHRRRSGDRAGADRDRGRGPQQGGGPQRARASRRLARARWRDRARGRQYRDRRARSTPRPTGRRPRPRGASRARPRTRPARCRRRSRGRGSREAARTRDRRARASAPARGGLPT